MLGGWCAGGESQELEGLRAQLEAALNAQAQAEEKSHKLHAIVQVRWLLLGELML